MDNNLSELDLNKLYDIRGKLLAKISDLLAEKGILYYKGNFNNYDELESFGIDHKVVESLCQVDAAISLYSSKKYDENEEHRLVGR